MVDIDLLDFCGSERKRWFEGDCFSVSIAGVLIVSVRWRNRNYSGSLIDIGHHEWAPPR